MKTSTISLREVPELKVQERHHQRENARHHQRENADAGPSGGVGAEGPGAPTINMKTLTLGPLEVPKLKVWERPPST
jgi:hypothetical protein